MHVLLRRLSHLVVMEMHHGEVVSKGPSFGCWTEDIWALVNACNCARAERGRLLGHHWVQVIVLDMHTSLRHEVLVNEVSGILTFTWATACPQIRVTVHLQCVCDTLDI